MRAAEISLVATDLRGINESFMEPDAKLEAVPIYRPDLHGAHLYYADLRGADLSGADLSDTLLRDADMRGCQRKQRRRYH